MTARYALYYVPAVGDGLYRAASAWLARDAYGGRTLERPQVAGLAGHDPEALTEDPAHYGFHATLKAPFELAEGSDEAALVSALDHYARRTHPFTANLDVSALSVFLAFRLSAPCPEMQALHEDCVREFDQFRAPLTDYDRARRTRPAMSPRQLEQLDRYGYAGIFEDFRFHMTLTGAIKDPDARAQVHTALKAHFAAHEGPHRCDGVALFRQPDRDSPFTVLHRASFGG